MRPYHLHFSSNSSHTHNTPLSPDPPPSSSPTHHHFQQDELVVQVGAAGDGADVAGVLVVLACVPITYTSPQTLPISTNPPPPPTTPPSSSPTHHHFQQDELVVQVRAAGDGADVAGVLVVLECVPITYTSPQTLPIPTTPPPPPPSDHPHLPPH